MLIVHPILQSAATLLALYVMYLGMARFGSLHLEKTTVFKWKRHVILGYLCLGTWLVGMAAGATVVYLYWHGILITGTHGTVSLAMVPFMAFGLASGLYMERKKLKRKALPLMHGVSNLVVLILALTQIVSGWGVYKAFVQGG
ncbi:MAG: DUF4079 domain-containing protein [Thermodesulfobacteriota bacterium]|nr:DUF4079 domain-containing protein [Thermodesulfobacteriota bacterium]